MWWVEGGRLEREGCDTKNNRLYCLKTLTVCWLNRIMIYGLINFFRVSFFPGKISLCKKLIKKKNLSLRNIEVVLGLIVDSISLKKEAT